MKSNTKSRRRSKGAGREVVRAAYCLSWDGRVLETPAIEGAKLREMVADGLLDEIVITWRPCLSGGPAAPMTGMDATFLPRGVRLELAGIRRRGGECVARYRVQTDRQ